MKGKLALLGGLAVGYVLGTRDGRERFEQIKGKARSMWNDPTVQQKVSDAQDFAKEKAPEVQEKVSQTAKDTVGKVTHRKDNGGEHAAGSSTPSTSSTSSTSPSTSSTSSTSPSGGRPSAGQAG